MRRQCEDWKERQTSANPRTTILAPESCWNSWIVAPCRPMTRPTCEFGMHIISAPLPSFAAAVSSPFPEAALISLVMSCRACALAAASPMIATGRWSPTASGCTCQVQARVYDGGQVVSGTVATWDGSFSGKFRRAEPIGFASPVASIGMARTQSAAGRGD